MVTKSQALERFDRDFDRAARRGTRLESGLFARSARYDARSARLAIELKSGVAMAIPVTFIQRLADATDVERRDVRLAGGGIGLHWPRLNVDLNVRNLLAGIFGNRLWMSDWARYAGSQTSAAKARASRANGAKGGRPRKTVRERAVSSR
jgi:hypothetical protein